MSSNQEIADELWYHLNVILAVADQPDGSLPSLSALNDLAADQERKKKKREEREREEREREEREKRRGKELRVYRREPARPVFRRDYTHDPPIITSVCCRVPDSTCRECHAPNVGLYKGLCEACDKW